LTSTPSSERSCIDCGGTPADFAILDDAATFGGWICESCDRRRRRRRLGWSRRVRHRVRRWVHG
jgi:hypothetical protein